LPNKTFPLLFDLLVDSPSPLHNVLLETARLGLGAYHLDLSLVGFRVDSLDVRRDVEIAAEPEKRGKNRVVQSREWWCPSRMDGSDGLCVCLWLGADDERTNRCWSERLVRGM
jgi:hypothetical protein